MKRQTLINLLLALAFFVLGTIMPDFSVYGELAEYVKGDMNDDSIVDAVDLALLKLKLAGLSNETETEVKVLDSGKCGENLIWTLYDDGLLKISGTGRMYDYVKYMEASPWYKYRNEPYISEDGKTILNSDGTKYLSTTDYYKDNPNGYKIKNIIIDEGVTYIGDWAFYRVCVDELTIPEGVEETGIFCIRYSPTIKKINLPDSLKVLDDFAISRNYELETINFGTGLEKIGTAGLQSNTSLKNVIFPASLTQINTQLSPAYTNADINYDAVGLLEGCTSLKTVSLGNVKAIPQRTFSGAAIENVVIPNTVEYIGEYAFYKCGQLKTVSFEQNSQCTLIDSYAFMNCSMLHSITGGTAIETIEGGAFNGTVLTDFEFSNSNKTFAQNLFYGRDLKVISIGTGMTTVPAYCFQNCDQAETIYLSKNVAEIGSAAFNGSSALKEVYYDGTLDDWNNINMAANAWGGSTPAKNVTVHFLNGTTEILYSIR